MQPRFVVRLSPDDVGRRVTVRARIPAQPGEPRHSDTVGYLRAWRDGWLHIERADGTTARINQEAVVAARVVPPPRPRRSTRR